MREAIIGIPVITKENEYIFAFCLRFTHFSRGIPLLYFSDARQDPAG